MPLLAVLAVLATLVTTWVRGTEPTQRPTGDGALASNPYEKAFGAFQPVTVSGTGTATVSLPPSLATVARGGIITIDYRGTGWFDIFIKNGPSLVRVDRGGGVLTGGHDGSVPVRGPYLGAILFGDAFSPVDTGGPEAGRGPWSLSVVARSKSTAPWTATFAPISSAKELGTVTAGAGDEVFVYDGAFARLHFQKRPAGGVRTLSIAQWDAERWNGAMPRGSGEYLYPGPSVVIVSSTGPWSATLE